MANDEQSEVDIICRLETFTKSFSLKIIGYSLIKKAKPDGTMVGTFDLGGHTWAITFFPYFGFYNEWTALHVSLLTATKTVITLEVEYSLFDHVIGAYSAVSVNAVKSEGNFLKRGDTIIQGRFMKNENIEKSNYLNDDFFMIKCAVKLVKPLWTIKKKKLFKLLWVEARKKQVIVPSSDFLQNFHQLWDSREGADVMFQVGEEKISAHRTVLAACSPVFRAEFFGPMQERKSECIKIKGIEPKVFTLMLQFVYTDIIPLNNEISFEMTQHLLVAAGRYGLEELTSAAILKR